MSIVTTPKRGLTAEEQRAVDAYNGPVTVCPPCTFTEGLFFIWVPEKGYQVEKGRKKGWGRGSYSKKGHEKALVRVVKSHLEAGLAPSKIARVMRMDYKTVKEIVEAQNG